MKYEKDSIWDIIISDEFVYKLMLGKYNNVIYLYIFMIENNNNNKIISKTILSIINATYFHYKLYSKYENNLN